MNIHHCVFKILGKKNSVADGRMDNVKTVYPPQTQFVGVGLGGGGVVGYNYFMINIYGSYMAELGGV